MILESLEKIYEEAKNAVQKNADEIELFKEEKIYE